ncbi:Fe2+-dicitrate sensor, membrane component [plant metagenome]|uniref:Fe2+-dicitrate sensor, membrane component n=1 Tax=plant metagenome TaxID=1297885 RepID=A0A484S2X5_9ZZZZ
MTDAGVADERAALPVDPALLEEAAEWVLRLRYERPGAADRQAFEAWLGQGEAQARAWARAEKVLGAFDALPAGIGPQAVRLAQRRGARRTANRRAVLRAGAGLVLAAPVAWLAWREQPWQGWTADLSTSTGERRSLTLDDGTQLVLNTASAVSVRFTSTERRLVLHAGEVFVETGHADPAGRPLRVETPWGEVEPQGTRFTVRRLAPGVQVAVFQHAVLWRPATGDAIRLGAGEQARFLPGAAPVQSVVDESALLWRQGMLVARNMRLADLLAELGRYRPGVLRCAPAVADLPVSGALSLADTDAALDMLQGQLPLRVRRFSRYWVSVGPA